MIEREQLLVLRNGHRFSLLVFDCAIAGRKSARWLARCLRNTDTVGWVGADRLGVLLPFTDRAGAGTVAERMSVALGLESSGFWPTIATYPESGLPHWPEDTGKKPCRGSSEIAQFFHATVFVGTGSAMGRGDTRDLAARANDHVDDAVPAWGVDLDLYDRRPHNPPATVSAPGRFSTTGGKETRHDMQACAGR